MKKNTWKDYKSGEELIQNIRRRHRQKALRRKQRRVVLAVCALAILLSSMVFASNAKAEITYAPVAVERGDSLWTLAAVYYPDTDRRSAIAEIKRVNHLSDSSIYEGDVLMLPDLG